MDASKPGDWMPPNPWCYVAVRPPGFFSAKKQRAEKSDSSSDVDNKKSNNAYLLEIGTFMCFSKKTDNPNPWCYAAVRPPGVFFRQKKLSENLIMRICQKNVHLYGFLGKLIIQTPGAMLRFALRGFFFGKKSFLEI